MTEFASTPDSLRGNNPHGGSRIAVKDWCEYHDLVQWLIPIKSRKCNPIAIIKNVKAALKDIRDTVSSITFREIGINKYPKIHQEGIVSLFKITREREISRGFRYLNPGYMHYDEWADPIDKSDRMFFYNRFKSNPTLDCNWYAKHFGIKPTSARSYLNKRTDHKQNMIKARRQIARTLYTASQWGYYGITELCRLLPITTKTVMTWVSRYAKNTSWKPPEEPHNKPWFTKRQHDSWVVALD